MRFFTLCGLCLALLSGCAASKPASAVDGPPVIVLETTPTYEIAASLSLKDARPDPSWPPAEPVAVSADTMGDILCDTPLPDGTEIVCYWEPGSEFSKYWAIRQRDSLLRFYEEYSAYQEGYSVEPFTDVLGQDGFRIIAPRGAAYLAYDYYVIDENGVPRLLSGCANRVMETDINGDGETELLWFYHGGRDIFYVFRQDGEVFQLCLTDLLAEKGWLVTAGSPDGLEESCLPVQVLQSGQAAPEIQETPDFLAGRLRFSTDTVYLELEQQ